MNTNIDYERYEFEYDYDLRQGDRSAHRRALQRPGHAPKRSEAQIVGALADVDDSVETGFDTTYRPSRHERGWLIDALGGFYTMGDITDVVHMVKGGKEACVYLCAANPDFGAEHLAAKVYRPRRFRNLRNDALYKHGRTILSADGKELHDERAMHAIITGTEVGKRLQHESWMAHEVAALHRLRDAGADVPRVFASGGNAILMSYVGDRGQAAPTLNHVRLAPGEARPLFERLLRNVEIMLACRCVHGDLSAYNVLYWEGEVTVIDFPQVVDPMENPAARAIFGRDVKRLCQYFRPYGIDVDAESLASSIWRAYVPEDLWLEHEPEFVAALHSGIGDEEE